MPDITLRIPGFEKLVDYVASGMGAVAGPILANWRARNEGKARLTASRYDAEVRRIEAKSQAESLVIISEAQAKARQIIDSSEDSGRGTANITRDDIVQSIEFQGRKRLANVASVVSDTADQLADKEVPNHEPDHDWTARFFDCVQDVSSKDMQKLWARILAGEVESPGRTSRRTLDTLRNMTKRDAEMFKDTCSFVVNYDFVFYERGDSFRNGPLEYGKMLHLQDCGLVNVGPLLVKSIQWSDSAPHVFRFHLGAIRIDRTRDGSEEVQIPAMPLTAGGRELCQIMPTTFQLEYLQRFSAFLKTKKCSLSYLESVEYLPDGSLRYFKQTPIEPHPS